MAETRVTRTIDVSPDALWGCVRAFDDVPWIPGGESVRIHGEGVGRMRIFDYPNRRICERLTSLDDATRTLTYTIPEGIPFPVTTYEGTLSVSDDAGRGRLTWSCRFEPEDGASEGEIAAGMQRAYGAMVKRLEAHLTKGRR
jgi:Polyketide cyclase / dehydrase and lipid transport